MPQRKVSPIIRSLPTVNGEHSRDTLTMQCRGLHDRACHARLMVNPARLARWADEVRNGRDVKREPLYL